MNFYEGEMRKMFGENDLLSDLTFIGKTMIGKLDENRVVKLEFVSTTFKDKYDAISAQIIDKFGGVIDKQRIKFSDVIGMYNRGNNYDPVEPHMWRYGQRDEWYTPISNPQKQEIADAVMSYVEMYQDSSLAMQFH